MVPPPLPPSLASPPFLPEFLSVLFRSAKLTRVLHHAFCREGTRRLLKRRERRRGRENRMGALLFSYLFIKRSRSISWNLVVGTILSLFFSGFPSGRSSREGCARETANCTAGIWRCCLRVWKSISNAWDERKRTGESDREEGKAGLFLPRCMVLHFARASIRSKCQWGECLTLYCMELYYGKQQCWLRTKGWLVMQIFDSWKWMIHYSTMMIFENRAVTIIIFRGLRVR